MITEDNELTRRTIDIIEKGGRILLRQRDSYWYLQAHTNIAAGPDHAIYGLRKEALPFFNLKWAFAIAPLYNCKVVVVYPKKTVVVSETAPHDSCNYPPLSCPDLANEELGVSYQPLPQYPYHPLSYYRKNP
jgi:ribosomal protein L27